MRRRRPVAGMKRVHLRDAGMLHVRQDFRLELEPLRHVAMGEAALQDLDGHGPARTILLRGVDHAHAAGSDGVEDEELAEPLAGLQRAVECRRIDRRDALGIQEVVGNFDVVEQRLEVGGQRHGFDSSARYSQARAYFHSLLTVAGEMSSAAAVSSMLRPAKYRRLTTWALRASVRSSSLSASSMATRSVSRGSLLAISESRSTRSAPAPRFRR